jgi:hypothetical protein
MITTNRARVREWRIHIGAHKTATTHVQNTLYHLRPLLRQHGITFLPHHDLRARLGKVMHKSRWHYVLGNWSRRQIVQRRILGQEPAQGTVLLSEENILGGAHRVLAPQAYPYMHNRLDFVRILASNTPTTIFLSIRSFDRVLPGAYATSMDFYPKTSLEHKKNIQQYLHNYLPSWVNLVERIQTVALDIPLRIWKQETYQFKPEFILSEFCGIPIKRLPYIPESRSNLTLSMAAVEEMERLFAEKTGDTNDWKKRTKAICRSMPVTENNPPYTFLSDSEVLRLQEQYRKDLEIIAQRWPGMLIETQ